MIGLVASRAIQIFTFKFNVGYLDEKATKLFYIIAPKKIKWLKYFLAMYQQGTY